MHCTWTLLRLNPASQTRYIEALNDLFPEIETYYPTYERVTRPARKRQPITLTTPVYPGYLFARIYLEDSFKLTTLPIRARFFRYAKENPETGETFRLISQIPDRVIDSLKHLESLNLLVQDRIYVNPYTPGTSVRVHLPIADIEAIIVHMIGQTRCLVSGPLGNMTVPLARLVLAHAPS